MEEELGAPMYRAVVVSKTDDDAVIKLQVRYHRKSILDGKRKVFEVTVLHGSAGNQWMLERYLKAKALKPGDEIYVDPYGEEWCDPLHHNAFVRKWNLKFA